MLKKLAPDVYDILILVQPALEPACWTSLLSLYQYNSQQGPQFTRDFSIQCAGHVQMGHKKWKNPSAVCLDHVREKLEIMQKRHDGSSWSWRW